MSATDLQHTAGIIKPTAFSKAAEIIKKIEEKGFNVAESREKKFTEDEAKMFYAEHAGKAFYDELITFMCSGPVQILLLTKTNAVADFRDLIGPTDPLQARQQAPESLRALYGSDVTNNAVHGSNTIDAADRELRLLFPDVNLKSSSQAVKEYLAKHVNPTLMKGLTELCKAKPDDPVTWLSDWLLANNPNKSSS